RSNDRSNDWSVLFISLSILSPYISLSLSLSSPNRILSSPNRILSSPCSPNSTRFFTVIFAVSLELLLLEGVEAAVTAQLLLPLWLICFSRCRLCCYCFEV
ncbi:hypothetical protein GIB67_000067, partial [Kingdonia uniflora]